MLLIIPQIEEWLKKRRIKKEYKEKLLKIIDFYKENLVGSPSEIKDEEVKNTYNIANEMIKAYRKEILGKYKEIENKIDESSDKTINKSYKLELKKLDSEAEKFWEIYNYVNALLYALEKIRVSIMTKTNIIPTMVKVGVFSLINLIMSLLLIIFSGITGTNGQPIMSDYQLLLFASFLVLLLTPSLYFLYE